MNQLTNPKLVGSLYLIAGVIMILAQLNKSIRGNSSNWPIYILGASFILLGVVRLRSKPPVR